VGFDLSAVLGHRLDGNSYDKVMRRNTSQSEYMLLFRGTSWHEGLSSEMVQTVMNSVARPVSQIFGKWSTTCSHALLVHAECGASARSNRFIGTGSRRGMVFHRIDDAKDDGIWGSAA
jgi:hypothetical protein